MMGKVKWHIMPRLRDWNDMFAESMGDASLIEHVWISPREIADNNVGPVNQRKNVLYQNGILPNIINTIAC